MTTEIGVGNLIQGWDIGVPRMSLGEKATLHIPAVLGYGARGAGSDIPPNADLSFDIELVQIGSKHKFSPDEVRLSGSLLAETPVPIGAPKISDKGAVFSTNAKWPGVPLPATPDGAAKFQIAAAFGEKRLQIEREAAVKDPTSGEASWVQVGLLKADGMAAQLKVEEKDGKLFITKAVLTVDPAKTAFPPEVAGSR
jgi:hypothetical protein